MNTDVVQVELIGQSWWAAVLPVVAILVSLTSLGFTLWFRFRDDARLRLSATRGYMLGSGHDGTPYLHLEATNLGRSASTVVQSVRLVLANGEGISSVRPTPYDSQFPASLAPAETAHVYMLLSEVSKLLKPSVSGKNIVVIEASTGHGKVRSRMSQKTLKALARF